MFKQKRIHDDKAGSSCPKKLLALSKEFGPQGICTASKKYQDVKLEELQTNKSHLTAEAFENAKAKITEKSCLCVGLANASYIENDIKIKGQDQGVVICPGPNMAYFDHEVSLLEMVQHIYGNTSILAANNRPNLFVKELKMYVDYLKNEIATLSVEIGAAQIKKWNTFKSNLFDGISYYENMILAKPFSEQTLKNIQYLLHFYKTELEEVKVPELNLA
jgi:hypothetical protein